MNLSSIVAMARNRVIGLNGQIPWHLPEDLKNFKSVTMGCPVLMGRKTFQSIGKPLPGRPNIVITQNNNFSFSGIDIFNHLDPAIKHMKNIAKKNHSNEGFIIGGAEVYKLTLDLIDRLYISEVDLEPKGDTWFPTIDYNKWQETKRISHKSEDNNTPNFIFKVYEKLK